MVKFIALVGLSPRLRGNDLDAGRAVDPQGVYPRACGGTGNLLVSRQRDQGLSPRLRGNAVAGGLFSASEGSIPALAGERNIRRRTHCRTGVYPRACGGTHIAQCISVNPEGLSPRLRGNVCMHIEIRVGDGSIPALAGERSCCRF